MLLVNGIIRLLYRRSILLIIITICAVFTIHAIYYEQPSVFRRNNTIEQTHCRYISTGLLVKIYNTTSTKKLLYKRYRVNRKEMQNNVKTSRYLLLIRLLLVIGCIEQCPGPTSVTCGACKQTFDRPSRLDAHLKNAAPTSCKVCGAVFCHEGRKQQHIRRQHPGHTSTTTCELCGKTFNRDSRLEAHRRSAIPTSCEICNAVFCNSTDKRQHTIRQHSSQSIDAPPTTSNEHPVDESVPILGNTTYQNRQRYKKMISQHREAIRTHTINKRNWKKVNKELSASFNYGDLKQILHDVMRNETGAFRINLGFGSMLYHPIDKVYRYFYVSANQYLFDKAYTISNHTDMTDFFNKIVSLDIAHKYYCNRYASGWVIAGFPNLEIKIMRIHGVPIGAGVELPGYIK